MSPPTRSERYPLLAATGRGPRPRARHGVPAAALLVCAASGLAGCWPSSSGEAALRMTACQSLLVLLNPEGSTFEVTWTQPPGEEGAAKVLYTVYPPHAKARRRILACTFERPEAGDRNAMRLLAVASDGQQLGPARVALLNRFWMRSQQARRPPPASAPGAPPTTARPGGTT